MGRSERKISCRKDVQGYDDPPGTGSPRHTAQCASKRTRMRHRRLPFNNNSRVTTYCHTSRKHTMIMGFCHVSLSSSVPLLPLNYCVSAVEVSCFDCLDRLFAYYVRHSVAFQVASWMLLPTAVAHGVEIAPVLCLDKGHVCWLRATHRVTLLGR